MIKHILIVDDDLDISHLFETFLKDEGFSTALATDGLDALLKMKEQEPDLMIADIMMDGMDGLALIREIRETHPKLPVIVISGGRRVLSVNFKPQAKEDGADEYMEKPIHLADLRRSVQKLLDGNRAEK